MSPRRSWVVGLGPGRGEPQIAVAQPVGAAQAEARDACGFDIA